MVTIKFIELAGINISVTFIAHQTTVSLALLAGLSLTT